MVTNEVAAESGAQAWPSVAKVLACLLALGPNLLAAIKSYNRAIEGDSSLHSVIILFVPPLLIAITALRLPNKAALRHWPVGALCFFSGFVWLRYIDWVEGCVDLAPCTFSDGDIWYRACLSVALTAVVYITYIVGDMIRNVNSAIRIDIRQRPIITILAFFSIFAYTAFLLALLE